jgi:hypothetical protein
MNDTGDPVGKAQGGTQLAPGASVTPPPATDGSTGLAEVRPGPDAGQGQPPQAQEPDAGDLEILSRFLTGILIVGGDELLQRLRFLQQDLETDPELVWQGEVTDDESMTTLLRYLAIGLLGRGQRRVGQGVRSGLSISLGATGWVLNRLNRMTDNRLTRPVRRPIEARLRSWGREADLVVREGKLEEQKGRWLAGQTVGEIIDDVLDFMSESPELDQFVRELIGQQSVGLAGAVRDNARQMSVVTDNVAEGVVRKLLRRTPRQALPPSPLEGKPQTMYEPETIVQETHDDDK